MDEERDSTLGAKWPSSYGIDGERDSDSERSAEKARNFRVISGGT
jgi:hypothetical protein